MLIPSSINILDQVITNEVLERRKSRVRSSVYDQKCERMFIKRKNIV